MKQKRKQVRVADDSFVPSGWLQNRKDNERGERFSNFVVRAVNRDEVRCVCVGGAEKTCAGGKYFIHPEDMAQLQAAWDEKQAAALAGEVDASAGDNYGESFGNDNRVETACIALCEINNGIAVLGDTLRDFVAAVQLLSEQQSKHHEHAGTWRDMNGESL